VAANHANRELDPERFRGYLRALARLQIAARPWLAPKLDASDLVQQTMLKAHGARAQFRGQSPEELAAWLRRILMRTLANALRSLMQGKRDVGVERAIEAELDASCSRLDAWMAADQTSPSEQAIDHERAERLAAAVAALPDEQQQVVLLKHCQGLSLAEIAARLNKTTAAVAGLLRRGLERLRETLPERRWQ
jgi:RNA polymerase sigma-70 factor (ECF subfamily)